MVSERTDAVMEAWSVAEPEPGAGLTVETPAGPVHLLSVETREQDGQVWVEATVDSPEGGDPAFRVFNPPALVPDPAGDVEIRGQRYRRDPVAALAAVIAGNGGARTGRRA